MNLAERRRALMMQQNDGNLFNINKVKICYRNSGAKFYAPKIENGILWSGGRSGYSAGGLIYVPLNGIDKLKFSANLHFIREDVLKSKTLFEIMGFHSIGDDDITVGDVKTLYSATVDASKQKDISVTINTSGYAYFGFYFWTEEQYLMGLSDIKIIKEV